MERDDLKGKQTKGVARVTPNGHTISVKTMAGRQVVAEAAEIFMDNTVRRANAALYAEAHNVANRTGMWPADMEERIKELEEASNRVMEAVGAVNQYRKEKNNPNLPKPLNSDVQTMWKELQDANNALAKTLRPHLFANPSTIN